VSGAEHGLSTQKIVIPAIAKQRAGIHEILSTMDSCFRGCEEIGRWLDQSRRVFPRPACGEEGRGVGFWGLHKAPELGTRRCPLTRNPRADAQIPTSPRSRGEVAGRMANSFTYSFGGMTLQQLNAHHCNDFSKVRLASRAAATRLGYGSSTTETKPICPFSPSSRRPVSGSSTY